MVEESREFSKPLTLGPPGQDIFAVSAIYAEHYWFAAQHANSIAGKKATLNWGLEEAQRRLAVSSRSGIPEAMVMANHVASKLLLSLARIEDDPRRRSTFLNKALLYRKRSEATDASITSQSDLWNRGLNQNYLADIQSDRANLAFRPEAKVRILSKAIAMKEK